MRKSLVKLVAVVMMLSLVMLNLMEPEICEASQTSVPSGYTPIYTIEDLYGINDDLNGKYILMNDIDMSATKSGGDWDTGSGWAPIGATTDEAFEGIFDGNGHRLTNMTIYGECGSDRIGLFATNCGAIKNLGVENINMTPSSGLYCGGIVGFNYIGGVIESCYITGTIIGTINSSCQSLGGIAGANEGDSIKNCYSDVDITGYEHGWCGGITGNDMAADIRNCYVKGSVSGGRTGAVAVYNSSFYAPTVKNCYYVGAVSDRYATKKSNAQMKMQKCFTGFDFKNTWVLDKNSSYPYPQLRNCMQVKVTSIELLSKPTKLKYTTEDKLDLTGSKLKVSYEDGYTATTQLTEDMVTYEMKQGTQTVDIDFCGQSDEFDITVTKAKESLSVTAKKTKLKIGASYTYQAKYVGNGTVSFESSNSSVLKINKKTGKAVAKKRGTVTIVIKAGSLSKKIKVKVV